MGKYTFTLVMPTGLNTRSERVAELKAQAWKDRRDMWKKRHNALRMLFRLMRKFAFWSMIYTILFKASWVQEAVRTLLWRGTWATVLSWVPWVN